jgi:quercetin 2,3-dioxygenase
MDARAVAAFGAGFDESVQDIQEMLMNAVRRGSERGKADHGWLKSFHTFSFAEYFDPKFTEFGVLRVINEDRVQAGAGFGTHSHKNMEIISYVLSGELAHQDSMGNGSTIHSGDVQRMSAGSGITHSEYNPSTKEPLHFLQIWIKPDVLNTKPSYEERRFAQSDKRGQLRLIVSSDGAEGSLSMRQDAKLYSGLFEADEVALLPAAPGRVMYVHVARGNIDANDISLSGGDALRIVDTSSLTLERGRAAEVLVFDLPPITSSGG